jgi:hypothetical protein
LVALVRAGDLVGQAGQQLVAYVLVPFGGLGVVADDEPVTGLVEVD